MSNENEKKIEEKEAEKKPEIEGTPNILKKLDEGKDVQGQE